MTHVKNIICFRHNINSYFGPHVMEDFYLLDFILFHFCVFVYYINFSSIFCRFCSGVERVLGGQSGRKNKIFGVFLGMLFETLFLVDFV